MKIGTLKGAQHHNSLGKCKSKPWWDITFYTVQLSSVQFSHSVMSVSLQPHELQHTRPPCPSPTPGVRSNSHQSSRWCHPAISSSVVPFSSCPQSLPASVFSNESALHMRWPKYWSFSFNINKMFWWVKVLVAQSCPPLCDPMDCSLPGFSIYGILQLRILEWIVISFSRRSSQPRGQACVSRIAGRFFPNST